MRGIQKIIDSKKRPAPVAAKPAAVAATPVAGIEPKPAVAAAVIRK